jgi:poly-D-alanine transfer protein DltD
MINEFKNLSTAEIGQLTDAPILVMLLIGAADGKFDSEERTWSARLLESRTYSNPKLYNEFYKVVYDGCLGKSDALMLQLPKEIAERNQEIAAKLSQINPIIAKLDPLPAYYFYKSLVTLAEETAKASGGFLRIGSVSAAEYEWVKLPMLTKIAVPSNLPRVVDEDEAEIED